MYPRPTALPRVREARRGRAADRRSRRKRNPARAKASLGSKSDATKSVQHILRTGQLRPSSRVARDESTAEERVLPQIHRSMSTAADTLGTLSAESSCQKGSLRLLRLYENMSEDAHPLRAASRQRAKRAVALAETASAARAAILALDDDRIRHCLLPRKETRSEPSLSHTCARTPLTIEPVEESSPEVYAIKEQQYVPPRRSGSGLESNVDNEAWSYFTGPSGRTRFFHAYKDAQKLAAQTDRLSPIKGRGSCEGVWIARDFSQELIHQEALPTPAILKQTADGTLALRGLGLSDGTTHAIAHVLPRLHHIRRIDVSNNNLGDVALAAICDSVAKECSQIQALDLSGNVVGECAAGAIQRLLACGHKLRALTLTSADVDDAECVELTKCLAGNTNLTELNLSKNLIGQAEALNSVNPDLVTGPEALAQALGSCETNLEILDLSWNYIRLDSAKALGASLADVDSLVDLRLEHNGFGDEGTMVLASALHENKKLRNLDLSFNSVHPAGALVLATMLRVNTTLKKLKLDGNPIGKNGALALISVLQTGQQSHALGHEDDRQVQISMKQCDTVLDGRIRYYDPKEPAGSYRLEMTNAFDRMVAMELLWTATHRDGCGFEKLSYISTKQSGKEIKLHRAHSIATVSGNIEPIEQLSSLRVPAQARGTKPSWPMIIARTIAGCALDPRDFDIIVAWLGLQVGSEHANFLLRVIRQSLETSKHHQETTLDKAMIMRFFWLALFRLADVDDSNCISRKELRGILKKLGVVASAQTVALTIAEYDGDRSGTIEEDEFVEFATATFESECSTMKTPLCEDGDIPWKIPKTGWLDIVFECEPIIPSTDQCGSDEGFRGLLNMLTTTATTELERCAIFDVVTSEHEMFLTRQQAHSLFEAARTGHSKVEKMVRILPQVASSNDCCALIETHLSREEKSQLMRKLGSAWGVLLGNATGHYSLDMRNTIDRLTWRKLSGIANSERLAAQQSEKDTSQHGNFFNWRNERWNGKAVRLSPGWFDRPNVKGKDGTLQFDYVSTARPSPAAQPMSRRRFENILQTVGLSSERLSGEHPVSKDDFDPYRMTPSIGHKATDPVSRQWREFLSTSQQLITPSLYSEERAGAHAQLTRTEKIPLDRETEAATKPGASKKDRKRDKSYSSNESFDDSTTSSSVTVPVSRSPVLSQRLQMMNPSAEYCRAADLLSILKVNIGHTYFCAAQIQELVRKFPRISFIRVELILATFSRCVDLENFARIIDESLSQEEGAECIHRLGAMNVFNSLHVDRVYRLSLSVHDERQMAKVLVKLAVAEPGENWVEEKFKRKESHDWMPGWELPKDWGIEVVNYGHLELRYVSTGPGIKPDLQVRRSLMHLFLCGGLAQT